MSVNGTSPRLDASPIIAPEPPQLDVSKLHALPSEQQDLFLLTFAAELRQYASNLPPDTLPPRQPSIKREVIKVAGLSTPIPSRVVRNSLGQVLADVFGRGSRQLLHETITDLCGIIGSGKTDKETTNRHTATVCIGFLFQAAGDSAFSLSGFVIATLIKAFKAAANHSGFRASIFRALGQIVEGVGSSIDETLSRDIWKMARSSAVNDKSALVQRSACSAIRALNMHTRYFSNYNDFDPLKMTIWKVLENELAATRNAGARVLAEVMVDSYSDHGLGEGVPTVRKPKRVRRDQGVEDEDLETRPETPTSAKPPAQLSFTVRDMLRQLSTQYCKSSTSNRARSGIAVCYRLLLERLPEKVIQDEYSVIASHFFYEVINHPVITLNRYRLLLTQRFVQVLLSDIVARYLLPENGQINAARWIINDVLKNYPKVMAERQEPPKKVLAAALRTLAFLLESLGPACVSLQDPCREALFQVLQHPSYTVQVHAAYCFRKFVRSCPQQLVRCAEQALSQIKKDLDASAEGRGHRQAIGAAMSVAAMVATARYSPLHGSIELYSSCFSFATDLLKASGNSELRLCATQVQVAWTVIGGLMALGPSFAKVHLNQLLLLWRNASPPPRLQENLAKRSPLEWSFLTHVRECALTALLTFLIHNSTLITLDGSKRLSTVLSNSVLFLEFLPNLKPTDDVSIRLVPALQLQDYCSMLRRRLLQCLARLMGLKNVDHKDIASQADIVGLAVRTLTNPERPTLKNLEASLASSASTFEGLWELGDNWAFGLSSLLDKFEIYLPSTGSVRKVGLRPPTQDLADRKLSEGSSMPVIPALEHDPALACGYDTHNETVDLPSAPTVCTTAAVQLFAITLPLQLPQVQESCIEQMATALAQPLQRDPGRKAALQLNVASAILSFLAVANNETPFATGKIATQTVGKITAELLKTLLGEADDILRSLAAQAMSRLCNLSGPQFTGTEIGSLIDMIVTNRDPNARAGCALALGEIHSGVGAMAASYHLKSIVGYLMSLSSDTHPTVHFWALKALAAVAESAGLSFSSYASSALGLLAQLYANDAYNNESHLLTTSNAELSNSTIFAIGQCVDSIINVLGPDLQESGKIRNLILTLVGYLKHEKWAPLQVQAFVCLGHISMYAPAHVQLTSYVQDLQVALTSGPALLQDVAISGIENLVKRNANEVIRVSKPGFGDELWTRLDKEPDCPQIKSILRNWMQQTCLVEAGEWVARCQAVLSRTRVKKEINLPLTATKSAGPDLADEDVAGLTAAVATGTAEQPEAIVEGQEFLRWQTRDFSMELLSEMLSTVQKELHPEHVIPAEADLQKRVADIVRVAFSASTASVSTLRVWGLRILDQILKLFGRTPDPDFLEASLLEQYQAQISSALTPAFAADSTPELAAVAIEVCATFVATGIVTHADRMGRIFKVLSNGLENLVQPTPEPAIGDLKNLSANAQSMLKMSILSGWAQLQLASGEQGYLEGIVLPYVPKLAPLWLSSLQEFAALRFEPEISNTLGGDFASGSLQDRYAALDREVRLRFYQSSWLNLVDAIAVLVEKDSNAVFDALDNRQMVASNRQISNATAGSGKDMSFREEPVAFFFILFGLAYEALVAQVRDNPSQALAILNALRRILTPAVSGNAIYQDLVFTETTDTLDRLALTSSSEIQAVLVEIARNLSTNHVVAQAHDRDDKLSDDIDQLFELTRIVILVLTGLVPTLEDPPGQALRTLNDASVSLTESCFRALVDVADVFPSVIRADLHACIIHCYCTMLATGICQNDVVSRLLPIFRAFLQNISKLTEDQVTSRLVRGCLARMLTILSVAQRRENDYAIVCAKNALLSITILLSNAGLVIPGNDDLVRKAVAELLDCLSDIGLAKVSAGCIRTLLMTNPKSTSDESVARMLWPQLLVFIHDPSVNDPEGVRSSVMQALVSSVSTLRGDGKLAAISILVPSLLDRAQRPQPNGSKEDSNKESAARLLELAGIDGTAFRSTISALPDDQRSHLESLLRAAGIGQRQKSEAFDSEEARPAIALRMDFD